MTLEFYYPLEQLDFSGKTLILPVVSTANVGQLAADLLIASLQLARIGVFDPAHCVPAAGAREPGQPGITTPLELYGRADCPLLVLQQRAPALKAHKAAFAAALAGFARAHAFGALLVLAGMDQTGRSDAQMAAPIYQLVPAGAPALAGSPLAALGTLPIPPFVPADAPTSANPSDIPHIPGGGLTRRLLAALAAPSPAAGAPPTAALLQFVLEGDNRGDAAALATAAAHAAGAVALLPRGGWAEPPSWRTGLFGGAVDGVLYS